MEYAVFIYFFNLLFYPVIQAAVSLLQILQ